MVYTTPEKIKIKEDLNALINRLNLTSSLDGLTRDEIINQLYQGIKEPANSMVYNSKGLNEMTRWNTTTAHYPAIITNPALMNVRDAQTKEHEKIVDLIDDELYAIVGDLVKTKVDPILELEKLYNEAISATPATTNLDAASNAIAVSPRYAKSILKNDAVKNLTDGEVHDIIEYLANIRHILPANFRTLAPVGDSVRKYLFEISEDERNNLCSQLSLIDRTGAETQIRTDLEAKVDENTTELTKVKTEYNETYKELESHINVVVDINGSLQNIFQNLGEDILSDDTALDGELDFNVLVNKYISEDLQKRHAIVPDYLSSVVRDINRSYTAAATLVDKKMALSRAKNVKEEVTKAQKSVAKRVKKDIKNWYRYVALDSAQFDNPDNHTGEFKWSMFDEKGNIVDDHVIGRYASAGLGFFQNLSDSAYIRYLTDGAYESIKELETGIVKKHKSLKAIGVNEALLWGLSHAITKSHKKNITHEIEEKYDAILDLDDTSSLFEIRTAYNNAANLGKELNHDAIQWTYRSSVGYDKLDNQLNRELCGWNYKLIDTGRDWLKKLSIFTKKETPNLGRSRTEGYDVDLTAFEPIKNPTLKSLSVLLGGTVVAYEAIEHIGKALSEKGGIGEIFKEILLFGGLTAGEKLLTKGSTPVAVPSAATTH